jgi:pimeloyl-ACP methyl ester carboxylesterase
MAAPTSHFITAQDGLRLHVRDYGNHRHATMPVVCLPGLARTCEDFHPLASALADDTEHPRQVIALDYRGRGRSDYDRNVANYIVGVELADILSVLTAFGIGPAVFVGTSRGGILAMLLAVARPVAMAGVVLNDIGPVIETRGLVRIKSYVGKLPQPDNFPDAADILRRLFGTQFPKLTPEDWQAFARRTYREKDGTLVPTHDVKLGKTLEGIDLQRETLPALWKEFDALARLPLMVVRGANSDVLSPATVTAMRERRPDLELLEVPDQGHAPLLADHESMRRITAFIRRCERSGPLAVT